MILGMGTYGDCIYGVTFAAQTEANGASLQTANAMRKQG
jgi:hypothetical protein